jgi:hypothetical protein
LLKIYVRVFGDNNLSEADMIEKGKTMAKWSLFFWTGAILAARLLSETYIYMTYGQRYLR